MEQVYNKEVALYQSYAHKIKLGKLYDTLKITPNKAQAEVIDDIDNNYDKYWMFVMSLGRRSGKSFGISMVAVRECMIPNASIGIIAPTSKITEIIWSEIKLRLNELGIKPTTINNSERKLTLENGAKIICGSVNSPEGLLGNRFSLLICDEAAIDDELEDMLSLQLLPTLSDFGLQENGAPYGRVFLISSPRGKNSFFYREFLKGRTGVRGYKSYQYGSSVNPMNSEKYLANVKANTDPLIYAQEYEAQFISVSSSNVLYGFDDNKHIFDIDTITPFIKDNITISGLDVGYRDKSAQVLVLKDRAKYYVYSSTSISQADTATVINTFKDRESYFGVTPESRFLDRTAAMFAADAASTHDFITYPSNSDVRLGFALINQLFREGNLYIEKSLVELIQQIVSIEWSEGKGTEIKRIKGHHYDELMALRYAIYTDFMMNSAQEIVIL